MRKWRLGNLHFLDDGDSEMADGSRCHIIGGGSCD